MDTIRNVGQKINELKFQEKFSTSSNCFAMGNENVIRTRFFEANDHVIVNSNNKNIVRPVNSILTARTPFCLGKNLFSQENTKLSKQNVLINYPF